MGIEFKRIELEVGEVLEVRMFRRVDFLVLEGLMMVRILEG